MSIPTIVQADALLSVYESVTVEPEPKPATVSAGIASTTNGYGDNYVTEMYIRAALESELDRVAKARSGERNDVLNRAAYSLGQLVADGLLMEGEVISALETTALAIGLDGGEIGATLLSGLRAGAKQPRGLMLRPVVYTNGNGHHGLDFDATGDDLPGWASTVAGDYETVVLIQQGRDDEGNAQTVNTIHKDKFLHSDALGWLAYDGHSWQSENAESLLDRAITETLMARVLAFREKGMDIPGKILPNANNVRNAKFQLSSIVTATVDSFDQSLDLLNCRNGVVDLRTGDLTPHDPTQRFSYCIPVDYTPWPDWSAWTAFLLSAVGSQEMVDYLQMAVGYSLTGHTREEIVFFIWGPPRSGKGTFTETILEMLGAPLAKEVDFQTFAQRRDGDAQNFDLAPLRPTRFVAASESSKRQSLDEAKMKALTGGNMVNCAFKYGTHFNYKPKFKIWLSSNHPVNADVDDDAIWTRLRVIGFPQSHVGKEDKGLKGRMRSQANLGAVLAWAVYGAVKWYMAGNGGLQTPGQVATATAEARRELDYVGVFIDECCELDPDAYVPYSDLYTAYATWCEENGVQPKHKRAFSLALGSKGFQEERKYVPGGNRKRCRIGIELVGQKDR